MILCRGASKRGENAGSRSVGGVFSVRTGTIHHGLGGPHPKHALTHAHIDTLNTYLPSASDSMGPLFSLARSLSLSPPWVPMTECKFRMEEC